KVSLADVIVLGGCAAVEQAARNAGHEVTVPFHPGRTDAVQEETDVEAFEVLEPRADGFRNYVRDGEKLPPETLLLDRANMLSLTTADMTALVGGMRALGANLGATSHGVFTDRPESLTNDFFVNLLDMGTEWKASESEENVYEGRDRSSGDPRWTASAVDLVFGANSQLRALAEVYAASDGEEKLVRDFVAAWVKVMELDRFDLR
ncbi:MAG TPA: peroxidase family protein, partial [Nocardioides sp.]|nr:peroxidase family protein [Nocardioides sp.]